MPFGLFGGGQGKKKGKGTEIPNRGRNGQQKQPQQRQQSPTPTAPKPATRHPTNSSGQGGSASPSVPVTRGAGSNAQSATNTSQPQAVAPEFLHTYLQKEVLPALQQKVYDELLNVDEEVVDAAARFFARSTTPPVGHPDPATAYKSSAMPQMREFNEARQYLFIDVCRWTMALAEQDMLSCLVNNKLIDAGKYASLYKFPLGNLTPEQTKTIVEWIHAKGHITSTKPTLYDAVKQAYQKSAFSKIDVRTARCPTWYCYDTQVRQFTTAAFIPDLDWLQKNWKEEGGEAYTEMYYTDRVYWVAYQVWKSYCEDFRRRVNSLRHRLTAAAKKKNENTTAS